MVRVDKIAFLQVNLMLDDILEATWSTCVFFRWVNTYTNPYHIIVLDPIPPSSDVVWWGAVTLAAKWGWALRPGTKFPVPSSPSYLIISAWHRRPNSWADSCGSAARVEHAWLRLRSWAQLIQGRLGWASHFFMSVCCGVPCTHVAFDHLILGCFLEGQSEPAWLGCCQASCMGCLAVKQHGVGVWWTQHPCNRKDHVGQGGSFASVPPSAWSRWRGMDGIFIYLVLEGGGGVWLSASSSSPPQKTMHLCHVGWRDPLAKLVTTIGEPLPPPCSPLALLAASADGPGSPHSRPFHCACCLSWRPQEEGKPEMFITAGGDGERIWGYRASSPTPRGCPEVSEDFRLFQQEGA